MHRCAILIPVYQPQANLLELVRELRELLGARADEVPICVVNDGSDAAHEALFTELEMRHRVRIVRHAVNLGKGAALKTGINAVIVNDKDVESIVTADGDGQHLPKDILRLVEEAEKYPQVLSLGVREFDRSVPLRSRFGNVLTAGLTRFLTGLSLRDTQTGLRAIPRDLCLAALRVPLNGYDFEMECLLAFRRERGAGFRIKSIPISTVYIEGNRSSHFNPLLDSMRIYFVFLRYCAGSLLTFATDYVIFLSVFAQTQSIGFGMVCARTGSTFVSFVFNRQAVFHAQGRIATAFVRFVMLVVGFGWIAYLATSYLVRTTDLSAVYAKLLVEGLLFFAGFAFNNVFVFDRPALDSVSTDWDDYYARPRRHSSITRRITARLLIRLMRAYCEASARGARLLELGGANSGFVDPLRAALHPGEYHIIDNNPTGLALSRDRIAPGEPVFTHQLDLLNAGAPLRADVTFSVGLIEHFDETGTARLIEEHFDATREGGVVILSFPTATWLYRLIRRCAEWLGIWIFHDERPLTKDEVLMAAKRRGELLYDRINWAIGLTQRVMVFRRNGAQPC